MSAESFTPVVLMWHMHQPHYRPLNASAFLFHFFDAVGTHVEHHTLVSAPQQPAHHIGAHSA